MDIINGDTNDVVSDVEEDNREVEEEEEENVVTTHYDHSTRPNYFICLRITDPNVRDKVKQV